MGSSMSDQIQNIIIIGASHAGLSCAEKLRVGGYQGKILVLERDEGLPLQRPPLSKTYLKADLSEGEAAFALRKKDWFDTFDICFRPGSAVTALDRRARQLTLTDGNTLSYDHLVLATGAKARPLPQVTAGADNLHVLRTAADARRLRAGLAAIQLDRLQAVVIGGGYIGLEVAASLRHFGSKVHIIEMAPRLLARVASPAFSAYCANLHHQHGVQVHNGKAVDKVTPDAHGRITSVYLADGTELPCQLVLAGIGILPDIDLAVSAGLQVDDGIVVDAAYTTSDANISAIGDVARAPSINPFRIESIHHAQNSGAIVAASLTGANLPPREAWWFWSDQYDVKFQIAGLVPAENNISASVIRAGRREGSLSVWTYARGNLASVEAANDGQAYMIGKKCLEAGHSPTPADIKNPDFVLKSLLG